MSVMEEDFLKMMGGTIGSPVEQGALLLAAVVLLGMAIILFSNWMMRKEKTTTFEARAVGLRAYNDHYFTVYEYRDDEGHLALATEETGSRSLAGFQQDTLAQINVPEENPGIATASARSVAPLAAGLLCAVGLFAVAKAFGSYPVNAVTFTTVILLVVFAFKRFGRYVPNASTRAAFREWRARNREALLSLPVQAPDALSDRPEEKELTGKQDKTLRIMGPLYMLAGAAAIAGALYFSGGMIDLAITGTSTRGIVTEIVKEGGNQINVVHFRDKDGKAVRFENKSRFDLPSHEEGDEVGVLYMESDPAGTAAIDYGWNAWLVPGLLAAFGLFTLLAGLAAMPRQRDEVR